MDKMLTFLTISLLLSMLLNIYLYGDLRAARKHLMEFYRERINNQKQSQGLTSSFGPTGSAHSQASQAGLSAGYEYDGNGEIRKIKK